MRGLMALLVMLAGLGVAGPPATDIDGDLSDARRLYAEGQFGAAIVKLQRAIVQLEQMKDVRARQQQLADAHLHLALSLIGLDDPVSAKESLKAMLRLDPTRTLDPQVHAPKVIALYDQARAELTKEPPPAAARAIAPAAAPAPAKKGGGKLPLILVGVGGAAAAGVALAAGGGDGAASPTSSTAPAANPTPTPTPTLSGSQDIALIGTAPPPGSTISLSSGRFLLVGTLSVVNNATGNYCVQFLTQSPGHDRDFNDACLVSDGPPANISLVAGQAQTVTVPIQLNNRTSCTVPFTVFSLNSCLTGPDCGQPTFFCRQFSATYTFVP